ncbi:MAG: ribosomal L7Ae/L30e/S12e/Gadd45 family protein [Lachnospiraceae bacterium]|nr:ribosomal L7Ae/L30e/S12e/Gadd45 family protein [Lachnospiraceae bacterium]
MLGLATKAGKTVSGEFAVEKAIKEEKAMLCIVAEDASDNTKKMFRNMCEYRKVPFFIFSDKESLGHEIGKEMRAVVAVLDMGFKNMIIKQLEIENGGSESGQNEN